MYRSLFRSASFFSAALALALSATPRPAEANAWVGDLVYCDANANGIYDTGDSPLNGVDVRVRCTAADGAVCVDTVSTTGVLHPSIDPGQFVRRCGTNAGWDPAVNADGRYLVELFGSEALPGCFLPVAHPDPWVCTATVDAGTLPADCNVLVTPVGGGIPVDGNGDGDRCDLGVDGPFPEAQILGDNGADQAFCELFPSPAPQDGLHMAIVESPNTQCALYNDFGYTGEEPPEPPSGVTRTIGFWKTHPDATAMFLPLEFCGQTLDQTCEAVAQLSLKGGGINNFRRQAVGAMLNCSAFGCPSYISDLIAAGSAACAAGDTFAFGAAGTVLDAFNNSGDAQPLPFPPGSANPKFCR